MSATDQICHRHGGAWGSDITCPVCTDSEGKPRPRDTYQRLGRFDSALDEVLYYLASSEDWAADHDGNQTEWGAYAWCMTIEGPLEGEELETVKRLAEEANPGHPIHPELVYGHWVVSVGSLGFVSVEKLPNEEELDNLWTAFKESYERWATENPEED
jgi:hypothetical protein